MRAILRSERQHHYHLEISGAFMKLSKNITVLALVLGTLPIASLAGDAGTLYTQIGSNGIGLGYAASVSKDWAVRGQYNTYKRSFTGDVGDFGSSSVLTMDVSLDSLQVVGDWYPGDGGFRLSGGVVFNNNKVTINGTGDVNGTSRAVNAELKMSDTVAPYIGLGYSTRPKDAKGFGFNFDLGVMFQKPKASLTAAGASQADIDAQTAKMQDAADKLKNMPVLGLGISYSF
jgi:hypothetical protein